MLASTVAQVKKGRVSRITRVHEDREVVRVEREGAEPGSEPVVEVVQQRQTRSTVNLRDGRGKNKKTLAALPAPGDSSEDAAEAEMLSTQEAEEMLSEAEELLNEPIPGKVHTTIAHHDDEAELNQPAIQNSSLEQDDATPGLGHHIEEVPVDTAHDEHDDPQVTAQHSFDISHVPPKAFSAPNTTFALCMAHTAMSQLTSWSLASVQLEHIFAI